MKNIFMIVFVACLFFQNVYAVTLKLVPHTQHKILKSSEKRLKKSPNTVEAKNSSDPLKTQLSMNNNGILN